MLETQFDDALRSRSTTTIREWWKYQNQISWRRLVNGLFREKVFIRVIYCFIADFERLFALREKERHM